MQHAKECSMLRGGTCQGARLARVSSTLIAFAYTLLDMGHWTSGQCVTVTLLLTMKTQTTNQGHLASRSTKIQVKYPSLLLLQRTRAKAVRTLRLWIFQWSIGRAGRRPQAA